MSITTLNVVSLDDGRILKKGGATPNPPSGGGEEYGVYLKILDVDCSVDEEDTTLKVDSPEVLEFFSDAFALGDKKYNTNYPQYSMQTMYTQLAKLAIEEKKKKLGKPNVFDSLQKRVPLLAFRLKEVVYGENDVYTERLLIIENVTDFRTQIDWYATSGSFYATTFSNYADLSYDDVMHPNCVVKISADGLEVVNTE
ncbi:MAG: hypothetical protein IKU16_06025 [Muribaculaceae bacterium]|nr:hypothetical protein [Muribaculaceae bacterium]